MVLADVQSTIQECKAFSRRRQAYRANREKLTGVVAELAALDQKLAELRAGQIEPVTKITDATVAVGRGLVEQLVQVARARQHFNEAIEDSHQATELELADQRDFILRTEAREFVSKCGEAIEVCLEALADSLVAEDIPSANTFCQQAQKITAAMREIQDAWPWIDEQAVQESWRQYRRGKLMDFDSFKHELLKAAK